MEEKQVKSFYKTSEFWLTIVCGNIAPILLAAAQDMSEIWAGVIMAVANGMYAISRGMAKK